MVQNKKRIISLILMLTLLVSSLVIGAITASAAETNGSWVETNISDISSDDIVVITWVKGGKTYAVSNDKGASNPPVPSVVTVSGNTLTGDIADNLKWNINNSNGNLTIYPNGDTSKWLYCTSTNNGVRVGTNANKTFTVDASSGYLKHIGTGRYLGIYNTQDLRCYTSPTATNIANQTLKFYVWTEVSTGGDTPACEHTNTTAIGEAKAPTCTEAGITAGVMCADCETEIEAQTAIPALGHTYVGGVCSCGAKEPVVTEKTYIFADYTAGTQYASGEKHKLDDIVTITTTECHFTTQLRIYSSSTHNGYAIISSTKAITSLLVNAGDKSDTLNIYVSNDGTSWGNVFGKISVTSSYKDYTLDLGEGYKYIKIDVAGSNQVRIQSMTLTFVNENSGSGGSTAPECQHTNTTTTTVEATCTTDGSVTVTCDDCSETVSSKVITAIGSHTYTVFEQIDGENKHKTVCDVCEYKTELVCKDADNDSNHSCDKCGKEDITAHVGGTATCTNKATCDECGEEYGETNENHKFAVIDGEYKCEYCYIEAPDYSGAYYIATIRTNGNYWYMSNDLGTNDSKPRYTAVDSGLTNLSNVGASHELKFVFVLVYNGDGTYKVYAEGLEKDNYLGWDSGNYGKLVSEDKALKLTVDKLADGAFNIHFTATDGERYLALNETSGNDYFAFYKSGQKQDISLISVKHTYTNYTSNNDATCVKDGTKTGTCSCGAKDTVADTGSKLEHTERTPATCTAQAVCDVCGNSYGELAAHEYFYSCDAHCKNCGELTNEEASHTPVHVEAKAPICTENGNVEYWYCSDCGSAWLDVDCTIQTNLKAVVLGATCATNAVHNERVEAGCTTTGLIENWYCANCDVYYLDAACTIITNYKNLTIPALGHSVGCGHAAEDAEGNLYGSVVEALSNGVSVTLVNNETVEELVINGAVLDLGGYTLTTKATIVFSGQIKGAGSLVVDKGNFSVLNGATLTEVPVKLSATESTETFVFRAVEDQQRVDVAVNDEGVTTHSFVFKPSFAMKDVMSNAELFGTDGTHNNNIKFGVIVSRTNANGSQDSDIIPVPDTLVYGTNKAFKMTLTGVTDDYVYSIRVVVIYDNTTVVYQGEIAYLNKKETN